MVVVIAIVGGLALIGSLFMTLLCCSAAVDAAAEDSEEGDKMLWLAAISVATFLMAITLFVLADTVTFRVRENMFSWLQYAKI